MSTGSMISIRYEDGSCKGVRCHWDGYPTYNGAILLEKRTTKDGVEELISGGDMSSLKEDGSADYYNEPNNTPTYYETYEDMRKDFKGSDCEYLYVFDVKENKWYVADEGPYRYIEADKGKVLDDLKERVEKDKYREECYERKIKWEPPKKENGMFDMFSARGSMASSYDYDLPIGLKLIDEVGYGCSSSSLCTIISGKNDNGRRMTYETLQLVQNEKWGDEPTWLRGHANFIKPYSERFGIGYYFDDMHGEPELVPQDELDRIGRIADENARIEMERIEAANREYDRQKAIGTARWDKALMKHKDAKAVVVAECMIDESEIQTDYFAEKRGTVVPLMFSRHTKRLFSEFRKAAKIAKIEGIRELADADKDAEDKDEHSLRKRHYGGWRIVKYDLSGGYVDLLKHALYSHPEYLLDA